MPKKKSGKPIPPAARAKARSARSQPASQRSLDADEPKAFAELRYFAEADPGLARECTQPIDVECHSRGGLVAAWWLRLSRRDVAHVIVVGAPLAGTTLASPAALRQALDHLATAVKGMTVVGSLASTVMPFMTILTGLTEILGKVLQLGADLPIADVAVVSVPGLASQSRVRNNAEMLQLFKAPWPSQPQLHAVVSNFRPVETDAGWRF